MNLFAIIKIHVLPDRTGVNWEGKLQLGIRRAHGLVPYDVILYVSHTNKGENLWPSLCRPPEARFSILQATCGCNICAKHEP